MSLFTRKLTVDHAIPTALGGSDAPTNLVTACQPCNAGKTSIAPDSPIVEDIAHDALGRRQAMELAAAWQADRRDVEGLLEKQDADERGRDA